MRKVKAIDDPALGERIRYLRKEVFHEQQYEFAKRLGMTRGAISNWEQGKGAGRASIELIQNSCDAFGIDVSLDWLQRGRGVAPLARPTPRPRGRPKKLTFEQLIEELKAMDQNRQRKMLTAIDAMMRAWV